MKNNDVARRLTEIQKLFVETAGRTPPFNVNPSAIPRIVVSGIPQPVESFSTAMTQIKDALGQAARTFTPRGSLPLSEDASGAGTAAGVRDEVRADVRGLANLALGLTPPSAAILEILSELEQGVNATTPPTDEGPVPYPPLRVAASVIAQADELLPMAAAAHARELFGRVLGEISERSAQWFALVGSALVAQTKSKPPSPPMDALNAAIFDLYTAIANGTGDITAFVRKYPKLSSHGRWTSAVTALTSGLYAWLTWWWGGSSPVAAPAATGGGPKLFDKAHPLLAPGSVSYPTTLPSATPPKTPEQTAQAVDSAIETLQELLA
jgi:hypothetical protein